MSHPLDRVIWHALSGRQSGLALGDALALRYRAEYALFAATIDDSPRSLSALREILPTNGNVALFTRDELTFPDGFSEPQRARVVQMVLTDPSRIAEVPAPPPTTRPLRDDDVPAMTALVSLTQPGPFAERTIAMGRYFGVFAGEDLIAMAGERLCLDGYVELSAVCTHPEHRGRGLAAALTASLSRSALARGETPFLHAYAHNETALSVYRKLGFSLRATFHLAIVGRARPLTPAAASPAE